MTMRSLRSSKKTRAITTDKVVSIFMMGILSMVTLSFMVGVGMAVLELTGNPVMGMTSTAFTTALICFITSMMDRKSLRSQD